MKPGKSFSEFMIAAEAALGSKPDSDRAYEAFSLGVSPDAFVKALVQVPSQNQGGEPSSTEQPPRSFQVAPSSSSFQLMEQQISPRRKLLVIAWVILICAVILSIWIPSGTANKKQRTEIDATSQTGPSYQLDSAKVSLRQAMDSGIPEDLQSALSTAERIATSTKDKDLERLMAEARKVEKAWKEKQQAFSRFEEEQITSPSEKSTPEKSSNRPSSIGSSTSR